MDFLLLIILTCIGLILGSFCTVCVNRLPQNLSIIKPRSFCINCKRTIQWFHNIPLFSFIFLKGKCGYCQKKISWIYPTIEALAVLSIIILYNYFKIINFEFIFLSLFFLSLIILFFCDFKFFLLPNTVVFFLYAIGLLRCLVSPDSIFFSSPIDCLIGFVAGIGFLYFFAKIYQIIRKKEGMGMGDVKLLGAMGLWLGWQSLFFIIIVSALLGILVGLSAGALGMIKIQNKIPYGCFLVLSAFLYIIFISPIAFFYENYMFLF